MKPTDHTPGKRPTLLIVESDILVRHPIAEYLRECGYKVLEAGNTDEALFIIDAWATTPDIV